MCTPQKVVIPKGLVNPAETTIVEIPADLKNVGTVVARPRPQRKCMAGARPPPVTHKMNKWIRRSMIKPPEHSGYDFNTEDPWKYKSRVDRSYDVPTPPPMPDFGYSGYAFGDISSEERNYSSDSSNEGFLPRTSRCSTLQDIDYKESTMFRDFRPLRQSSRPNTPDRSAGLSMASYSSGDPTPGTPSGPGYGSCYPSGYSGSPVSSGSPGYSSSPGYSGSSCSPGSTGSPSQRDVMSSLGELESMELQQIMGDLSSFQAARRQLVFDSSSLQSASDVAASFMH